MKEKVFFSGINGIGMSGLALILAELGYEVEGSDLSEKEITKTLRDKGIKVYLNQKKENLLDKEYSFYVYSTAIKEDNPEYVYAEEKNIKMFRRGELLAKIMDKLSLGIAVAGTHGKTTTSSLMSSVFLEKKPYIAVGGIIPLINANYMVGNSEYFIAEADESDNTFLYMHPYYSIITNIEADHLDFHKTLENIILSFKKFVSKTKKNVLVSYDCPIARTLKDDKIIYYSVKEEEKDNVSIYAKNIRVEEGKTVFEAVKNGESLGEFRLSIPGIHNVSNALGVIYISLEEKIEIENIRKSLELFKGAKRRYQVIYEKDFKVIDDYAHHPTEILATIKAAKLNEGKEISVIFQPHRYSRTHFFLDDFVSSLKQADNVFILPIYSASEENIYDISSEKLVNLIGDNAKYMNKEELFSYLKKENKKDKVYIFMGAGSISTIAHEFVEGE